MSALPLFATVPKGMEHILARELRSLGANDLTSGLAGIAFEGDLELAYRVCLWSRTASRVLLLAGDQKHESIETVTRYAEATLGFPLHELDAIQIVSLNYLYGGVEDKHQFVYRERRPASGTQRMRIGQQPKQRR